MKNNYQTKVYAESKISRNHALYFLEKIQSCVISQTPELTKVLDVGCGAGDQLIFLRRLGYDAWGYEINPEEYWPSERTENPFIKYGSQTASFPFESNSFDFAIANQVLEHVDDLDILFSEISRTLKPHGCLFATFPLKSSFFEQHCFSPLAHRLPKGALRRAWLFLTAFKSANLPAFTQIKGNEKYGKRMLSSRIWDMYLQKCCHYRTTREIERTGEKYFSKVGPDRNLYGDFILNHLIFRKTNTFRRKCPSWIKHIFCLWVNDAWTFQKKAT